MKGVDDPEFILLRKAKELKTRIGESEEIDELIMMTEGIIQQNLYAAVGYIALAVEFTDRKEQIDILIQSMEKMKERDK